MASGGGLACPMDPELARSLFFEGAAVVALDVPEGTEFGIDCSSWQVGPRFRGVKMIPPGVHLVHYSAAGRGPGGLRETGPRTGFFVTLPPRGLRLLRWDAAREELDLSPPPEEQLEAARANLRELDRFLGPYPYELLRKWVSLSSCLSAEAVQRLQPESGQICAFSEVLPVLPLRHTKDRAERGPPPCADQCRSYREGLARLPQMEQKAGTEIRFTKLPKQPYPDGASPAEITKHSMDLSYALETVISRQRAADPQELLAELQFAFICFLIGHVYDAFEHWKQLLNLLCRAEEAIGKYSALYSRLISILYHQLAEIPADFFVDIISQDNFLTSTLQVFFSYICSTTVDETLRRKAEKFKAHLTKKFKWDFETEPDDCAPVVVELPEGVNLDMTG